MLVPPRPRGSYTKGYTMSHRHRLLAALIIAILLSSFPAAYVQAQGSSSGEARLRVLFLPLDGSASPELEQAAALMSQNLRLQLIAEGEANDIEVLTLDQIGRVGGRAAPELLSHCQATCAWVCQARLGRTAGLDWIVTGSLEDASIEMRRIRLRLFDLGDSLALPIQRDYPMRVTGHHSEIAENERIAINSIIQ